MKNDLGGYLSYVRKGGVVRVFDRDRPIAEIVPLLVHEPPTADVRSLLAEDSSMLASRFTAT